LVNQLPLRRREAEVVVGVVPGHGAGRERAKLLKRRRRLDDERREQLLEDVAVSLQEERRELADVVGDEVDLQPIVDIAPLDGLGHGVEPDDLLEPRDMRAAEIDVRIGRREAVEVGAADGREDERVRMGIHGRAQSRIPGDVGHRSTIPRRARMR
jgi:hypothetical protein